MDLRQSSSYYTLYHYFRERFVLPLRQGLYRFVRTVLLVFIVASVGNFLFSYYFVTPKMHRLEEQNKAWVRSYQTLARRVDASIERLTELRERDHAVYRAIFSTDTLDIPGIYTPYPAEKYASVGYGRYAPLMTQVWEKMDALGRELYLQSLSYDEIEKLAVDKDLMAEVVPAIMPLDKNKIRGDIGAFGMRMHPILKRYIGHEGIDMGAERGTPVYATGTGLVYDQKPQSGYGIQIVIDHGFGYQTRYAHLNKSLVKPGQLVKRGEKIGEVGSTGRSTGPHLHYEVIYRGRPVNPINYISRDMSEEEFRAITESAKATTYELDE
ncbi:MAG: peptidoglycan DD-metalloendopeptidase family protein [Rikenella sp.]|nr:peptidoglycan DD-metalloendopeptidase family protein [Rikenella sp.]